MAAKPPVVPVSPTANTASMTTAINNNFDVLAEAIEDGLSRTGSVPNQMESDLDMNSHRIYNLAEAVNGGDAVNLGQVEDLIASNSGGGGVSGDYLLLAGGVMTGAIGFIENDQSATLELIPNPNSPTGDVFNVTSDAGVHIGGPFVVIEGSTLGITVPGAVVNSVLTVANVSNGVATLGYTLLPAPSYAVTDTNTSPVTIKTSGAAVPSAWVSLGLNVTLAQDIPAGTANLLVEGVFANTTNHTGVLEFGARVNGGAVIAREILIQITQNYNQTIAINLPILTGYLTGTVVEIFARVTENSNNNFNMTMANSATDIGAMRIYTVGGGSGGGGGSVDSVGGVAPIVSSGGTTPQISIPAATSSQAGYLSAANFNTFNNKANANGTNATGNWPINITGIANKVDDVNSVNALSFWFGTEAQYTAIGTKDPNTVYLRSA